MKIVTTKEKGGVKNPLPWCKGLNSTKFNHRYIQASYKIQCDFDIGTTVQWHDGFHNNKRTDIAKYIGVYLKRVKQIRITEVGEGTEG